MPPVLQTENRGCLSLLSLRGDGRVMLEQPPALKWAVAQLGLLDLAHIRRKQHGQIRGFVGRSLLVVDALKHRDGYCCFEGDVSLQVPQRVLRFPTHLGSSDLRQCFVEERKCVEETVSSEEHPVLRVDVSCGLEHDQPSYVRALDHADRVLSRSP